MPKRTQRHTESEALKGVLEIRSTIGGRVRWVAGSPGEVPAYAGTDFIIARDGRIAALYLFFDKLP
jgi:hypothetical protein